VFARISAAGVAAWYDADHLGSVRVLTDNVTGAAIDTIDYDAYGNIVRETMPANGDREKWAGLVFDPTTGLYGATARSYDPASGRWLQQDPLGLGPDSDPYRYAGNGPTDGTDPSGFWQKRLDGSWLDYFTVFWGSSATGRMEEERGQWLDEQARQRSIRKERPAGSTQWQIPQQNGQTPAFGGRFRYWDQTTQEAFGDAHKTVVAMGTFVLTSMIIEAVTRFGPGVVARPLAHVFETAMKRVGVTFEKGLLARGKRILTGPAKEAAEQALEREFRKTLLQRLEYHVARAKAGRTLSTKLFPHDGIRNNTVQKLLGKGEWREWMVVSQGAKGAGAERLLTGPNGQIWYSPNHYKGFIRIDDESFTIVGSLHE
jgi:RHS repeat-associated protein